MERATDTMGSWMYITDALHVHRSADLYGERATVTADLQICVESVPLTQQICRRVKYWRSNDCWTIYLC